MKRDRLPSLADDATPSTGEVRRIYPRLFRLTKGNLQFLPVGENGFEFPTPTDTSLRHPGSPNTNVREACDFPDARRLHQHKREYKKALTPALLLRICMAAGTARNAALGVRLAARLVRQTAALSHRTTSARSILAAISTASRADRCSRRATSTAAGRRRRGLGTNSETNHSQSGSTQQRKHRSTVHNKISRS